MHHHTPPTDAFRATRASLRHVAIHVVARARSQTTGRFSLRVTPGGFGTPEFGESLRRVRVSGTTLIVEQDAPGAPSARAIGLDGATLIELAEVAGVDLAAPLDVGHDTTPVGDVAAGLTVDTHAARLLAEWLDLSARALDHLVSATPAAADPTSARLWPEHFDVALDVAAAGGTRANFGGSCGDDFHDEPYLYVGPWPDAWPDARPGADGYWNAPFGAVLGAGRVPDFDTAVAFFTEGLRRLAR